MMDYSKLSPINTRLGWSTTSSPRRTSPPTSSGYRPPGFADFVFLLFPMSLLHVCLVHPPYPCGQVLFIPLGFRLTLFLAATFTMGNASQSLAPTSCTGPSNALDGSDFNIPNCSP
ncbi:hypothetical protein F4775DRAFT_332178 [Biscogniauxia sp. FL1348]|nr:hypothetical protein F4775DRAFT_332178 [Biscogniauxia sp. FL1348]